MFPILYENITVGTVPQDNGLGVLSDAISCFAEQERNGIYEVIMEYPASGIHASEIALRRILKVKPNYTDNPQLFRIDRIGKTMNGKFTVYGKHISYDMSGYSILPSPSNTANNIESACELLENATKDAEHPTQKFTISTLRTTTGDFSITAPSSVKSWFVGKEGSILDVYGGSDIKYDNFSVDFKALEPATDRGVTIRYAKNLLELSQEMDCSNLCTHVLCYYKSEDVVKYGTKIATGLSLDVPKVLILDITSEFDTEPTEAQITTYTQNYVNGHNLTVPENNITLDFVQVGELKDRVDLCDTVTIYYEALGISTKAKCIRTKWDCIREKYIETEFGDIRQDLSDTMVRNNAAITSAASEADAAITIASSKKRTVLTVPIPPYDRGDIWVNNGVMYACNIARSSGYVNYLGITTTPIGEGSTTQTITINGQTHTAQEGDVVFYDDESEETANDFYIWLDDAWTDYATHIIGSDWILATNYVDEANMNIKIAEATEIITGNAGGFVIFHDADEDGHPDELLIVNYPDITDVRCNQVWRFNKGGLGYATSYASDNYALALTNTGAINASLITTGELDASKIIVSHLAASMFEGGKISLGGYQNLDGVFELKNSANEIIATMDKNGLKMYGEGTGSNRAYVLFDSNGMAGYDTTGTKIFWTNKQEFHMKKAVVEDELDLFGIGKFVRLTTYDENNNVVNDGIALVGM